MNRDVVDERVRMVLNHATMYVVMLRVLDVGAAAGDPAARALAWEVRAELAGLNLAPELIAELEALDDETAALIVNQTDHRGPWT